MLAGSWGAGELAVMLLAYVLLAAAAAVVCSGSCHGEGSAVENQEMRFYYKLMQIDDV